MRISKHGYNINGINYIVRSAELEDAAALSNTRVRIDGETENMDRESGEAFLDAQEFERIILADTESVRNLFLVAAVEDRIVGYSRCEGSPLKRLAHKVEFGVGVLKDYWGYGIGKNLLKHSIEWADHNGVRKIVLQVLETNEKAIALYRRFGFEVEGVLKNDKLLSDGKYYHTVVMGRFNAE